MQGRERGSHLAIHQRVLRALAAQCRRGGQGYRPLILLERICLIAPGIPEMHPGPSHPVKGTRSCARLWLVVAFPVRAVIK